jgi:hypothetical protein
VSIALTAVTPISWEVSYALPDVFAATLVLGLFSLLYLPRERRRGLALAGAIFMISSTVHFSHAPLAAALIGSSAIARGAGVVRFSWRRLALAAILLAGAFLSYRRLDRLRCQESIGSSWPGFYVNRMAEGGLLQKLLREHCRDRDYALCPYADEIPSGPGAFLYARDTPFEKIGGWRAAMPALERMIVDSVRYDAWSHARMATVQTLSQVRSFRVASEAGAANFNATTVQILSAALPEDGERLRSSRQSSGTFKFPRLDDIYVLVVCSSGALLLFLGIERAGGLGRPARGLMLLVGGALLFNAFICGTFSDSLARYQSRVVWLLPFCAWAVWESAMMERG